MKSFFAACIILVLILPAVADNQLYTGDATTVPIGRFQYQLFQDSTPSKAYRFAGTSLTYGISPNAEARLAYGRLWSNISFDAKIGPNIGAKWRFMGNGRTNPSMAVSVLYSQTDDIGGSPAKPDYGALLIASYPGKHATLLGNFGRVWVGESRPDLYYLSFASVWRVSPRTLFALQYSDLKRIGRAPNQGVDVQYTAGVVYTPDMKTSYSLQIGYLPNNPRFHVRATLGFSIYF